MIHRLKQVYTRDIKREVSCYHNSTEFILVKRYRLECQSCSYNSDEQDYARDDYIRDKEIDHNFEVIYDEQG